MRGRSTDLFDGCYTIRDGVADVPIQVLPEAPPVMWQLKMTDPGRGNLQVTEVEDMFLVVGYEWE